jgi:hypothetical protein
MDNRIDSFHGTPVCSVRMQQMRGNDICHSPASRPRASELVQILSASHWNLLSPSNFLVSYILNHRINPQDHFTATIVHSLASAYPLSLRQHRPLHILKICPLNFLPPLSRALKLEFEAPQSALRVPYPISQSGKSLSHFLHRRVLSRRSHHGRLNGFNKSIGWRNSLHNLQNNSNRIRQQLKAHVSFPWRLRNRAST